MTSQAIYIFSSSADGKVSGHFLSRRDGRDIVHNFRSCTLPWVIDQAEYVIHGQYGLNREDHKLAPIPVYRVSQ